LAVERLEMGRLTTLGRKRRGLREQPPELRLKPRVQLCRLGHEDRGGRNEGKRDSNVSLHAIPGRSSSESPAFGRTAAFRPLARVPREGGGPAAADQPLRAKPALRVAAFRVKRGHPVNPAN
jgi:hypothetical protein